MFSKIVLVLALISVPFVVCDSIPNSAQYYYVAAQEQSNFSPGQLMNIVQYCQDGNSGFAISNSYPYPIIVEASAGSVVFNVSVDASSISSWFPCILPLNQFSSFTPFNASNGQMLVNAFSIQPPQPYYWATVLFGQTIGSSGVVMYCAVSYGGKLSTWNYCQGGPVFTSTIPLFDDYTVGNEIKIDGVYFSANQTLSNAQKMNETISANQTFTMNAFYDNATSSTPGLLSNNTTITIWGGFDTTVLYSAVLSSICATQSSEQTFMLPPVAPLDKSTLQWDSFTVSFINEIASYTSSVCLLTVLQLSTPVTVAPRSNSNQSDQWSVFVIPTPTPTNVPTPSTPSDIPWYFWLVLGIAIVLGLIVLLLTGAIAYLFKQRSVIYESV